MGTGSVFQADATTTSEFSGSPGQDYNSTYQYFTYDIPLSPTISLTVDAVSGEHFTNVFGVLQGTTDSSSIYAAFYDSSGSEMVGLNGMS